MKCKCKGCTRSYIGCHDRCSDYKEYRTILDGVNKTKKNEANYNQYLSDLINARTGIKVWVL